MSAATTPDHRGDGGRSTHRTLNRVERERMSGEKEPSGTMQLLDRLGYGLVALSSLDTSQQGKKDEDVGRNVHRNGEPTDDEPFSARASVVDPAVAGTSNEKHFLNVDLSEHPGSHRKGTH